MNIDYERLKNAIENSSEIELDIESLLKSAEVHREDFVKVKNNDLFMIFNSDYELVECAGNATNIYENNECEREE